MVEEVDADNVFIPYMKRVWKEERKTYPKAQDLERLAKTGENIVPWNLFGLMEARERGKIDFGVAFALLARRQSYSDQDFLHALLGIVKADMRGEEIKADLTEALSQISVRCIESGDYSPITLDSRTIIQSWQVSSGRDAENLRLRLYPRL